MFLCVLFLSVLTEALPEGTAHVEVRAVLISCEPDDGQGIPFDNEARRFEREELFKHSVLRDCRKKIALTVKIASDPDNSGDEYIPIEHVFQGPKKRVRLLNPYVLRLRREPPVQAYKLRKIDTVSGTLAQDKATRIIRNIKAASPNTFPVQNQQNSSQQILTSRDLSQVTESCEIKSGSSNANICLNIRNKRQEKSMDENAIDAQKDLRLTDNDIFTSRLDVNKPMHGYDVMSSGIAVDDNMLERSVKFTDLSQKGSAAGDDWESLNEALNIKKLKPYQPKPRIDLPEFDEPNSNDQMKKQSWNTNKLTNERVEDTGKEYDMYEIGNADLWYTLHVQLFEKLSTPEGKTVWNDLTKGEPARVSSLSPKWSGPDMSIRYRTTEWIPRDEFTLPMKSLCLLAPVDSKKSRSSKTDNTVNQYIVVPREDVVGLPTDLSGIVKHDEYNNMKNLEGNQQTFRRVFIRTSRDLLGSLGNKVSIVPNGEDRFLTLAHRQPYHAQIDLEARADGNQLVHVGSFGRIMTVVADSSRRTRTVLTVQATNTGLVSARFRVEARDCNPELPEVLNEKVNEAADSYILLPPKHTQSIRLEVPTEIPVDEAHCSVALKNGDDQSVAVRDVTIRKGDRCFCVWHCECVCLGEDSKLLCREMPEARQIAAGLSLRERTRHVRSVCYHDVISLNVCISAFGVLLTLFLFGLIKACLGLVFRSVALWGLSRILQMPRKLDHYYEYCLRDRPVVYDDEGWPVHPDTMKRTVCLVSIPMEFILNTIFFVSAPCVIIYDALKLMFNHCRLPNGGEDNWKKNNTKNYFSAHDMQTTNLRIRRRRNMLQRWMTPEAEKLTSNVMETGIPFRASMIREYMRPLLAEELCRGDMGGYSGAEATRAARDSCPADVDSDADDTEYVLTQMQKSRESLAKNQRKLNASIMGTTASMKKQ